jgi:hypothetical protein
MIGNNTKNQAKVVAPPRHITFSNHVQNKTYIILIKKIMLVLDTSQLYEPKQYKFTFPIFCKNITANAILEITKYTYAGVHKSFNPTNDII